MPGFARLDLRATHLFSLPSIGGIKESSVCVAYIEALNILDIRNVLSYSYSPDYTQIYEEESYFGRRFVVAGFSLSW